MFGPSGENRTHGLLNPIVLLSKTQCTIRYCLDSVSLNFKCIISFCFIGCQDVSFLLWSKGMPSLVYVKNFSSESSKESVKNRDNDDSCGSKIACQDPPKSRCNKNKKSKTERTNTNPILSDELEKMKNRKLLEEYFSRSLEIELLLRLYPDDEDTIYQIVDLLVDTCDIKRKLIRIAGDDKPAEVVLSRLKKLNADHIRFVLDCLAANTSPIRNMKQYLLAALFNAPTTIQLYYQNKVNHDLAARR